MKRYIALLRGINVGGNNKISMKDLKTAFERHGFSNVSTYINSGNVIFESVITDTTELKERCEGLIADEFRLKILTAVLSADDLIDALKHKPSWWNEDAGSKHNAIFVITPATAEEICAMVGATKPEYELAEYYGSVIFWTAPLETFSMTRWSKVVSSSAYSSVTIRNANTAIKLAELVVKTN